MACMEGNKVKVTSTMRLDLVDWVDKKVENRDYASRSHCLEVAVLKLKRAEEGMSTTPP